jgi:hypothetical protein
MTRIDFCKPYLLALYLLNRKQSNVRMNVGELQSRFFLPRDDYLEGEVVGHMLHQNWVVAPAGDPSASMIITENGKIHAETYMEQGLHVLEVVSEMSIAAEVPSVAVGERIPASDRIVLLTDNQEELDALRTSLAELSDQLKDANDVGAMTELEVDEARREIWLLEQSFNCQGVRVDWIEPIAKGCLKWISEKAAGATVGEAAKKALLAFLKWLAVT